MPLALTYPGVYIEEIPSGVRTIVGVATSITAFIGRAKRGPDDEPVRIQSFAEFERKFGGLWVESTMSYAVYHFFLNGGTDALIVRVCNRTSATPATIKLPAGGEALILEAAGRGDWGNNLQAIIDYKTKDATDPKLFNLEIDEVDPVDPKKKNVIKKFLNISIDNKAERFITTVLEQESDLVRVQGNVPANRPDESQKDANNEPKPTPSQKDGKDGLALKDTDISKPDMEASKQGIWALEKADLFNLLCIPPLTFDGVDVGLDSTISSALKYCLNRRAILIMDPPSDWTDVAIAVTKADALNLSYKKNAAIFFPGLKMPDPQKENRLGEFVPCGAIAGIFARTDSQRGVWKAPAGIDATLTGVMELTVKMTDPENGLLNPIGVNCLRSFPVYGNVVWGSRTMEGADQLASEWKYIPVRRTALFIEESLYRGTKWVVFEPNDEPLWAQIRLNVGAFMHNLFRQGAFQGKTPRDAYLVKCDKDTTTQNDIDLGIVNILVGFAPLKPAEFVVIQIQQMAGQIQT
ncbi:Phage tail sheath protein subtilisin-like domain protein [uncultured archaeon]|nr:Phage tail sheath protein subtilisin-like domain protein [uncultured archaeon]